MMNEKERYVGLLLQLEFAENSHRDMLILAAKYKLMRTELQDRHVRSNLERLGCNGSWKNWKGCNEFSITVKCIG